MNGYFIKDFTPYLEAIQSEAIREGVKAIWEDLFEQSELNSRRMCQWFIQIITNGTQR